MKNLIFFLTFCFLSLIFFANFSFLTNAFLIYILFLLFQRKNINYIFILLSGLFLDLLTNNSINFNFMFFSILILIDFLIQKYIHYDSITSQIVIGEIIILIYTLLKGTQIFLKTNLIDLSLISFFAFTSIAFILTICVLNKYILKNE